MDTKVMIGVVKLFKEGRGVIAPQPSQSNQELRDLYFESEPTSKFRPGQLVRFQTSENSSRAFDVAVLSEKY